MFALVLMLAVVCRGQEICILRECEILDFTHLGEKLASILESDMGIMDHQGVRIVLV